MRAVILNLLLLLPAVGGIVWARSVAGRAEARWWSVPKGWREVAMLLVSGTLVIVGILALEAGPSGLPRLAADVVAFSIAALGYLTASFILRRRSRDAPGK